MHIVLVGISYRTAPVEVREHFALNKHQTIELGQRLLESNQAAECVIVSTCNRTEIYAMLQETESASLAEFLCCYCKQDPKLYAPYFFTCSEVKAIDHLFRVASGLDSMIVGEAQILAQIKEAYQSALEAGITGRVMNTLFRTALSAGKRGRTETEIGHGAVSVSHAAVELARKIYSDLNGRTALVLGAGEMSEITARLLVNAGVKSILVSNRTYKRAQEIAEQIGGLAIEYDRFPEALQTADIVISSTGAPHTIIHKASLLQILQNRRGRPIFMIDIAVPRDIDPDVSELDDVFLYDIDDLQSVVSRNVAEREKEVEKVQAILEQEKIKFMEWYASLDAIPTIAELQQRLEAIRQAEMERFGPSLSKLSDEDRKTVELITQGLIKRILKQPMAELKQAARNGNGVAPVETVRLLFGLDSQESTPVEK